MIPEHDLEGEVLLNLLHELTLVEDFDNNGSIFMQDFTFFDRYNNHILNAYRFNMGQYTNLQGEVDRFSISFFDYVKWYYESFHNSNQSNNPCNYARYYCSKNTGPAWKACRTVAAQAIGASYQEQRGPSLCKVEKIAENVLRYSEIHNNFPVLLNYGARYIYWEYRYDKLEA